MPSLVLIVPGSLETLTGGYGYDRRIAAELVALGWSVDVRELDGSFPLPTQAARDHAAGVLGALAEGTTVLVDGLALGALPAEVEREAARLRLIGLVHHPLAAETGLDAGTAARLESSERRALAAVRRIIVTSRATAETLVTDGVDRNRIVVVEPGTDRAPLARGSKDAVLQLLCVAALIPRKGHDILFRALAAMSNRNWRLTCAGSPDRDPGTTERLRERLRAEGLGDRVWLGGEMNTATLAIHYDSADIFVLPTLYEGYGMAVAEALARGLPVVSTDTGGIGELVGDEAGILVPPGDVEALAAALAQLVGDTGTRERLEQGARRVRERLPTWEDSGCKMAEALNLQVTIDNLQRGSL